MKKLAFILLCSLLPLWAKAADFSHRSPQKVDMQYIGQILYTCDHDLLEATVEDIYPKINGYYIQSSLRVPSTITLSGGGIGIGGGSYSKTFAVVALGTKAFHGAVATEVIFVEPSQVRAIGTLALSEMANMTGKLTLPASLEHLDVSSILLPGITEIEFLGEVPPTCDIAGGYNPWTSATEVTSADIKITVPDGALSAYQDAEGIGDYFTCLKKEDPTSLQDNEIRSVSGSRKVWRGNQLLIEREGVLYNMVGARVQ